MNFFLSLQYTARELDFNVLLATRLAQKDRRILFGHRRVLLRISCSFRGGLYVGKDLIKSYQTHELRNLHRIRAQGFGTIHLDEEGAVHAGDDEHFDKMLRFRLDPRVLSERDWICTWGARQQSVYSTWAPKMAERIVTTGHPRFDLLKDPLCRYHQEAVDNLKSKHHSFFLFCTNFQRANHMNGPSRIFERPGRLFDPEEYGRERFLMEWSHSHRMLSRFVELIHVLSARFPNRRLVVRPHPTEDLALYQSAFKDLTNVVVDRRFSVQPWILACDALIHNGCTTGIEGWLAGKPVINYAPLPSGLATKRLPAEVSVTCQQEGECIGLLNQVIDGRFKRPDASKWALDVFRDLQAPALESYCAVIEEAALQFDGQVHSPGRAQLKALAMAEQGYGILRENTGRTKTSKTEDKVFPPFSASDLRDRFRRASEALNKDVRCQVLGPRLALAEIH
jgi:surface carbohydrate biosynthesis protein